MIASIAVSTYMSEDTRKERLGIFKDSIQSLLDSNFQGKIFIVDDGSVITDHLDWVREKKDSRVRVIKCSDNSGISRTKNIGITYSLNNQSDLFFLVDDDVIYTDKEWFYPYVDAHFCTGLQHFSYGADVRPTGKDVERDGVKLRQYTNLNGCLLFLTKKLVTDIGFFKRFPNKYGYEHCNYTYRHNKYYNEEFTYDVHDSDKLLKLHPLSEIRVGKSMVVDSREVAENGAHIGGSIYEGFE